MTYQLSIQKIRKLMDKRHLDAPPGRLAKAGGWPNERAASQSLRKVELGGNWVTWKTLQYYLKAFNMGYEHAKKIRLVLAWQKKPKKPRCRLLYNPHKKKGD